MPHTTRVFFFSLSDGRNVVSSDSSYIADDDKQDRDICTYGGEDLICSMGISPMLSSPLSNTLAIALLFSIACSDDYNTVD